MVDEMAGLWKIPVRVKHISTLTNILLCTQTAAVVMIVFGSLVGSTNALHRSMDSFMLQNSSSRLEDSAADSWGLDGRVNITIRAMASRDNLVEYPLHTLQDFDRLQKFIATFPDNFEVVIERNSKHSLVLYLSRNSFIISKGLIRKYYTTTGDPIVEYANKDDRPLSRCFFTGKVLGNTNSLVSFNLCNGVNGVVEFSERVFYVETIVDGADIQHRWSEQLSTNQTHNRKCGTKDHTEDSFAPNLFRHRNRFSRELRLPAGHNSNTKYIELYVVMDNALYRRTGSVDATIMRAINIVNYASALYRQLDIYLALVGVEVWSDRDKISQKLANGSVDEYDPDWMLAEFNKYRYYKINRHTANDGGQLFSALDFVGGTIGKGSTGTICTQTNSGGVTYDEHDRNYVRAATTMAHELGHNLRMSHSDTEATYLGKSCECDYPGDPDFKSCIMYSSSSFYKQATKWSECTKDRLDADFAGNLGACLMNKPQEVVKVGNSAVCGNFFVEEGEECDCGHPAECLSKCCDASTCTLFSNATCATGACCDLDTCSIRTKSTLCRPLQDSECDLEEFCDGSTEWCPTDTYKYDGTVCYNRGDAYCYSGKCNSHNSQCHFIWGSDNSRSSDDICYTSKNGDARYFGNCGWKTTEAEDGDSYLQRDFLPCAAEQDKFCGLLHCNEERSGDDLDPRIINFALIRFTQNVGGSRCTSVAFDVGYQNYDPGQVPNGAKCGDESMCINSKCVSLPPEPKSCDCNGHGVCNQNDECHCDVGWAPPTCKSWGLGGSTSSNPPVIRGQNLTLIVGLIAFFCGIVPIILVILIVAYHRRKSLKREYHRMVDRFKKTTPRTIHQSHLGAEVSTIEGRNEDAPPTAVYYRPSAPSNGLPSIPPSGGVRDRVQMLNHASAAKNGISSPVLQSTTNEDTQHSKRIHSGPTQEVTQAHSQPSRAAPTRAAPPRPNIPHRSTNNQPTYENVKPATAPKPRVPPQKPAVMPKPNIPKN